MGIGPMEEEQLSENAEFETELRWIGLRQNPHRRIRLSGHDRLETQTYNPGGNSSCAIRSDVVFLPALGCLRCCVPPRPCPAAPPVPHST